MRRKVWDALCYLSGAVLMLVFLAGIWTILTLLEAWMT